VNGTMTTLITSYTHSKMTALSLSNRLTSSSYFGSVFSFVYSTYHRKPLTHKALHFKGVMHHPAAKQKGNCTS